MILSKHRDECAFSSARKAHDKDKELLRLCG